MVTKKKPSKKAKVSIQHNSFIYSKEILKLVSEESDKVWINNYVEVRRQK